MAKVPRPQLPLRYSMLTTSVGLDVMHMWLLPVRLKGC